MKTIILLAFVAFGFQSVSAQNYDPRRTISVSGNGEIKVAPNEVILSMSIETNDMSLDKARTDNDAKVSAVIAMVRKLGVEDKFIQTDYIHVEPRFDNIYNPNGSPGERRFLGYYMTKNITITLRDITKFEKLIADALKLGTNYINGINFQTTELRKYRDQARLDAIKAAKEKAMALAEALGQKIGKPITISEGSSAQPYYKMAMQNSVRAMDAGAEESGGSIAPGEIKIEANVSVTFELE